ncbi:guanine deaminase [Derxia gummosa]|uniref:Guanine deaminase n=1 Tax=Derxia gummosa DSM 723 TaxID=1121388 RepID=A0A8B6X6P4_9BURK|nr:guanine deaminase [Derxia gummosa]
MTSRSESAGKPRAFRSSILHCLKAPGARGADGLPDGVEYFEDGVLVVENGHVVEVGPAHALLARLGDIEVVDQRGKLILPGFVDGHIHSPQVDVIASYGTQLLDWLERYTFPSEQSFARLEHARETSRFFLDELLRNGTTTAVVFATVHEHSVDALFELAQARQMRLIAGKVLMDRNAPAALTDTAASGEAETRALIERWHGRDRLSIAITPRFAITSTPAQLESAGRLAREFPDVYIQTHVAENHAEIAAVRDLFPDSRSYVDVYDRVGLLRERALYGHCVHLDAADRRRMAQTGAVAVHCPTSNLFLGSGLFDFDAAAADGMAVCVGSDVGGGTSYSMLRTLSESYKIGQLKGTSLSAFDLLHLGTLAGAKALGVADRIGRFVPGAEADFIVIDWAATPVLLRRSGIAQTIEEKLFALVMLGDDRAISACHVLGENRLSPTTAR